MPDLAGVCVRMGRWSVVNFVHARDGFCWDYVHARAFERKFRFSLISGVFGDCGEGILCTRVPHT